MPKKLNGGEGIVWPDGKRLAVMVTFDFDAESLQLARFKGKELYFADRSRGEYGPDEGLKRCLDLLDRQGVESTFFIPGYVMEKYPEHVREIGRRGHEIGYHGYLHETVLGIPREEEEANMARSEALLLELTGKKFRGHRAPGSVMQKYTLELIHQRGYLYSSAMKTCDWVYCYEKDGKKLPIVELPTDYCLDDYTYYFYTLCEPYHRSLYNNRYVREIWQDEFDGLAAEGDKIMVLKLHPQLIGRASRARLLEEFVAYMRENGAWITTCEKVARYVLQANGLQGGI